MSTMLVTLEVNKLRHIMMDCDVKSLVPQIRTLQNTPVNAEGFKRGNIVQDHRSCIAMEYLSQMNDTAANDVYMKFVGLGWRYPVGPSISKAGISGHLTREM